MLDALGRQIHRHPLAVVVTWFGIAALAFAVAFGGLFGQRLFDRLTAGTITLPGPALEGANLILASTDDGPIELAILDGVNPYATVDPTLPAALNAARADLSAMPQVKAVGLPLMDEHGLLRSRDSLLRSVPFIADDGRAVLIAVTLRPGSSPAALEQVRARLRQLPAGAPGSLVLVGGVTDVMREITDQVEVDLRTGEGVALPLSLLIMIVVFGGFLAAGLPIIGAITSIAGAMATLLGFSYLMELDASTVNVVTVLGLGLCIDYGLLLVSRYREELHAFSGRDVRPNRDELELVLRRTMTTAGRTVTFSGVTVAVALSGLMCFRASFLRAIGAAGVSIVAVALLVALTLVPALLALGNVRMARRGLVHRLPLIGPATRALQDVVREEGFFARMARLVQRFPLIVTLIVLAALAVMSLPLLGVQLVASGSALLPVSNPQRQVFDNLQTRFQYASLPAVQVVAKATLADDDPYLIQLRHLPAVLRVDPPIHQGDDRRGRVSVLNVHVAGSDSSPIAIQVVREIRQLKPGFVAYDTGTASALVDYQADLRARTPWAIGIVVSATFLLLFLMTGSVLVPIKALFMNVVSLGACLGALVWIFQDGWLEGLLQFTSAGGIETFIPPLVITFGFGLAMDYEVFLLSRIAEYRRQGHSNDEAVVFGLQRSGRIITSAALIVIVVFLGIVAGKLLIIKETGAALAVAVAIDATLVRLLLVPATMTMLGDWNWWAPKSLRRLHDRCRSSRRRSGP
jgi:RND superfamily putative drug exporter